MRLKRDDRPECHNAARSDRRRLLQRAARLGRDDGRRYPPAHAASTAARGCTSTAGFTSDFDGGVTTLSAADGLNVMTVSLLPLDAERLQPEDVGRADVVIYTGERRRFA